MAGLMVDRIEEYKKDMYRAKRAVEENMMADQMTPKIFKTIDADFEGDKETQMLGIDRMQELTGEDGIINFTSPGQGWTARGKVTIFAQGIKLSYKANEFMYKNQNAGTAIKQLTATIAAANMVNIEQTAAKVFDEGDIVSGSSIFDSSYINESATYANLPYDGVCLFNLSSNLRTLKSGTTVYNTISGLTLSESAFRQVWALHTATNNISEEGFKIKVKPNTILTREGDDYLKALEILNTKDRLPDGQLNNINPLAGLGITPMSWAYLNDAAFYIGKAQDERFTWMQKKGGAEIDFFVDYNTKGPRSTYIDYYGPFIKAGAWQVWSRGHL